MKAEWNFGSVFEATLKLFKNDILNSEIFTNKRVLTRGAVNDETSYMFSIPFKNREIDWELINS